MIHLRDVSKVYHSKKREVRALDGVSLDILSGEFVTLRGASGSGKSTLLLTIGGMIRPTSGVVEVAGEDLYALSPRKRSQVRADAVGFVFQMFHLIPYLDVVENVLIPNIAGATRTRPEAEKLLATLQLSHRLRHRPAELSTGERQRVALARALLKEPRLILADEPTGNLDPANAAQVMDYLAAYNKAGGTVVVVTHDPAVDAVSQRKLLMDCGKLVV